MLKQLDITIESASAALEKLDRWLNGKRQIILKPLLSGLENEEAGRAVLDMFRELGSWEAPLDTRVMTAAFIATELARNSTPPGNALVSGRPAPYRNRNHTHRRTDPSTCHALPRAPRADWAGSSLACSLVRHRLCTHMPCDR